jgi:hypothetical protein
MERVLLEYGVLGLAVVVFAAVINRYVLLRLTQECESLRAEIHDLREKYDHALTEQLIDYKSIVEVYNQITERVEQTLVASKEVMEAVLEHLRNAQE